MSRQDDLKKLIAEHYRHLQILKQQEAGYGSLNVPTHLVTQIQDREAAIEQLQAELATVEETEKESPQPKLAASPAVAAPITPTVVADPQMVARRAQPRIFLCHASEDKPRVTELYHQLKAAGYHPWLDKYDLLPGQNRRREIEKIIRDPYSLVLVCLSSKSVTKRGVVQQEITWALDILERMPEETIYLIPVQLEECDTPERLSNLHWVDLFEPDSFEYLRRALDYEIGKRQPPAEPASVAPVEVTPAKQPKPKPLGAPAAPTIPSVPHTPEPKPAPTKLPQIPYPQQPFEPELILIPAGEFIIGSDPNKDKNAHGDEKQHTLYLPDYYIAKTPVTNAQYAAFVQATKHKAPYHWEKGKIPEGKENHPVVYVSWDDAVAFCQWLSQATSQPFRLPTEAEWEKAARGTDGHIYPWGNKWDSKRCNTQEDGPGGTTPVGVYPTGASPYGVLDMAGNVWEWTNSLSYPYPYDPNDGRENPHNGGRNRVMRGGSWDYRQRSARCACRRKVSYNLRNGLNGFRVAVSHIK